MTGHLIRNDINKKLLIEERLEGSKERKEEEEDRQWHSVCSTGGLGADYGS